MIPKALSVVVFAALLIPCSLFAQEEGSSESSLPLILSNFYSQEVADAYAGSDAQALVAALEKSLAEKEKLSESEIPGRKEFVLASHHLFLAHTYQDKLKQPAKAAAEFKVYVDLLGKSRLGLDFLTKDFVYEGFLKPLGASIEPDAGAEAASSAYVGRMSGSDAQAESDRKRIEASRRVIRAIEGVEQWVRLRQAWAAYIEAGLNCGDKEALAKGEALLKELASAGGPVETKTWLKPTGGEQKVGPVVFKLKALHPNQADESADYAMPLLKGVRHFILTVENKGPELVKFTADDFALSGVGERVTALPEDSVPAHIAFGAPLEQFVYAELSPYTFSAAATEAYDQDVVEANQKKDELIAEAKKEEKRAKKRVVMKKVLVTLASIYMVLGQAQMAVNAGQNEAYASHAKEKASEARSKGFNGAARAYETKANEFSAMASQSKAGLKHLQDNSDWVFNYKNITVANDKKVKKAWAKVEAIQYPDVMKYPSFVLAEREFLERAQSVLPKLTRFAKADRFLPVKGSSITKAKYTMTMGEMMAAFDKPKDTNLKEELGSAVRVKPGKTWTGFLIFDAPGEEVSSPSLSAKVRLGDKEAALTFPLAAKQVYVLSPRSVSYTLDAAGEGVSWGDVKLDNPQLWPVLIPKLD